MYLILGSAVAIYLSFTFFLNRYIYKGYKDEKGWIIYNVPSALEFFFTILYLGLGGLSIYILASDIPIWYEWILPIVWILFCLSKAKMIYSNRNNYIKIKDNQIEYKILNEVDKFRFSSYKFILKKSKAISYGNDKSWFLQLESLDDQNEKSIELDLKDLNLIAYKKRIENHLQSNI